SSERTAGGGQGRFSLTGQGSLNGAPFRASVVGDPLLDVDPNRPYDFAADIRAGAMRASARGRVPHPFNFAQVEAEGRISGEDLANLYYLTGLTLPNTPPYDVSGRVSRNGERFAIDITRGRIGSSDIAGRLAVAKVGGRRKLTGDLASHKLNLADLTATLGGAPKGVLKRTVASPRQEAVAARMTAAHRVLPDARLEVPRIRNMDADVRYRAGSVAAGPLPIRALALHVILDRSLLVIDPLSATLPLGSLAGRVSLDARGGEPVTTIDLSLANAEVQELLPTKPKGPAPFAGPLAASARLRGVGDSVRKAAASANGVVAVAIPHGQMRQLFAELLGIDVGKSLFLYLSKDEKPTPIRCGVAIFRARNGVLVAQTLVLDTGAVLAQGKGYIDLRNETLNLEVAGKPKHLRLLRVAAPITLTGRFDAPKPGVEIAKALPQAGIGAALGALVSPLAALLPFISTGGAKNANCPALLSQARADGAPLGR
ncbi:MAG: AsmA family protein, partial [Caulobacteraceae bacterium]